MDKLVRVHGLLGMVSRGDRIQNHNSMGIILFTIFLFNAS